MSTKAKAAAVLASAGVLAAGWQIGTAHGQTVAAPVDSQSSPATDPTATAASSSATATTAPSQAATTSSPTTATSAGATTYADGTYTGTTTSHRFGSVTVTVTISGGTITSLSEKVVSDGDRKSDAINSRAVPVVKNKVLSANSASVSTVSGATYTTKAYLSSLQSALNQAR